MSKARNNENGISCLLTGCDVLCNIFAFVNQLYNEFCHMCCLLFVSAEVFGVTLSLCFVAVSKALLAFYP